MPQEFGVALIKMRDRLAQPLPARRVWILEGFREPAIYEGAFQGFRWSLHVPGSLCVEVLQR